MSHAHDRSRDVGTLGHADYRTIATTLHAWTGIRLQDKEYLVEGRLRPRLRELGLSDYRQYLERLLAGGERGPEAQAFINALTTNKTSFFREPHHFEFLVDHIFASAKQRAARGEPKRLRLWSAACSRGAEPYTMALLATTHLPADQGWDVKILATDLDTNVLEEAREGIYTDEEVAPVPEVARRRWFQRIGSGRSRVSPEVQRLVTFAQANLVAAPFPVKGRFDAVFCRNVMIYFDRPTQERLVDQLVRLLTRDGVLVVGHSESLLGMEIDRDDRAVGAYRAARAPRRSLRPGPQAGASVPPLVAKLPQQRIVLGQWLASDKPMQISTLLGSCVAACIFDPEARVGGMNHFMLPRVNAGDDASARFGLHAMELLINDLLRLGASRQRLQAKAFGAAAVNRVIRSNVAEHNEQFVRQFLKHEGIELVADRLGGVDGRDVRFRTDTGEAEVRRVRSQTHNKLAHRELDAWNQSVVEAAPDNFNPDDALF